MITAISIRLYLSTKIAFPFLIIMSIVHSFACYDSVFSEFRESIIEPFLTRCPLKLKLSPTYLPKEDAGCCGERFDGSGSHGDLHHPGEFLYDDLQDTEIIKNVCHRAEEYHHRENLENRYTKTCQRDLTMS